jgi:predicted DNA-binding transcriptional regulator AlpA
MNKLARRPRNRRSIKIGGKIGTPVANQPAKLVAKAKPIPCRQSRDRAPPRTGEGPARRYYRARDIAGPEGILPIGISTFWRWVGEGLLPQPIRLGSRCSVWEVAAINEAIAGLEDKILRK